MLEVELKFRIDNVVTFRARLAELPVEPGETEQHCDTYFRHPVRDFAVTDEAFRCRVVDDRAWLTYKGPRLDGVTKSREELELPLADAAAATTFGVMAVRLGFQPVREVRKAREHWVLRDNGREIVFCLDTVPGLGTFCEIETLVATQDEFGAAREAILSWAHRLGLHVSERKSYLCLLLEQDEKM